jgi:hypothetical protein
MTESEARDWLKTNLTGPLNGHDAAKLADRLAASLAGLVNAHVRQAIYEACGRGG